MDRAQSRSSAGRIAEPIAGAQVRIPAGPVVLAGDLDRPEGAVGIVLFAHGSGSSRRVPATEPLPTLWLKAVWRHFFSIS